MYFVKDNSLLRVISKISYKFSTNAIFILFSIFADQVLTSGEYGRFTILLAIQLLIFNLSDVLNSKFLLGKFSSSNGSNLFNKIFSFKAKWSLPFISLLSLSFLIYAFQWKTILLLIFINFLQILSSTIATYIFSTEKGTTLLLSNAVGSFFCFTYLFANFILLGNFDLTSLLLGILIYRLTEVTFLLFTSNKNLEYSPEKINYNLLREAAPFYLQLVLSIVSAKLFVFFLPLCPSIPGYFTNRNI